MTTGPEEEARPATPSGSAGGKKPPGAATILVTAGAAALLAIGIQVLEDRRAARGEGSTLDDPPTTVDQSASPQDAQADAEGGGALLALPLPSLDAGADGDAHAASSVDDDVANASGDAGARDARCAAITIANDDRWRHARTTWPTCRDAVVSARRSDAWRACVSAPDAHAAWALAVTSVVRARADERAPGEDADVGCRGLRVAFAIAHVDADGNVALASPGGDATIEAGDAPSLATAPDFDGDGDSEVLVVPSNDATGATLWTFRRGSVARYFGATEEPVAELEDVDLDDRVDVVTRGPYPRGAPSIFLAHALDDGGFSTSDLVARRYARRACGKSPPRPTTSGARDAAVDDDDAVARRIVCARVWGASEAAARALADGGSGVTVGDLASVRPPIRLP